MARKRLRPKVPKDAPYVAPPWVPPVALLTHSPDPGLYSRLERAVESLPTTVKIEGLRNRLQKHPEGVPGWELDRVLEALELENVNREVAGNPRRDISRKELLEIVRSVSPAFTHRHSVLKHGYPAFTHAEPGRLGDPTHAGQSKYGWDNRLDNYQEHLLLQFPVPSRVGVGNRGRERYEYWKGGHWSPFDNTIAHMRVGDAGDAKRLVELQSDIRNENLKYGAYLKKTGAPGGTEYWPSARIPLYDHSLEILLKSLLLDGARSGARAIEIPALEHVTHGTEPIRQSVYGQMAPNTLLRIAKPLGGLIDATPFERGSRTMENEVKLLREAAESAYERVWNIYDQLRGIPEDSGLHRGHGLSMSNFHHLTEQPWHITPQSLENFVNDLTYDRASDRLAQRLFAGTPAQRPAHISEDGRYVLQELHDINTVRDLIDVSLTHGEQNLDPDWDATRIKDEHDRLWAEAQDEMRGRMPEIARAAEEAALAARQSSDASARYEIEAGRAGARLAGNGGERPIPAPSRRLEISDSLRRNILEKGIPLSVLAMIGAATGSSAKAEEKNVGFTPTADGKGFTSPAVEGILSGLTAESPAEKRSVPLPFSPRVHQYAKELRERDTASRERFEGSREDAAARAARLGGIAQVDFSPEAARRTLDGLPPDVAEFQATKESELARPTISAQYIRDHFNGAHESDDYLAPDAVLRMLAEQEAVRLAIEEGKETDADAIHNDARALMITGGLDVPSMSRTASATAVRDQLLDVLNQHAPGGEYSDRSGIEESEYQYLQSRHGKNADSMYPERQRLNFDALRQYELFAAGTPLDQSRWPSTMVVRGLGQLLSPLARDPELGRPDSGGAREMADVMFSPKDQSVARSAMRWYRASQPREQEFDGSSGGMGNRTPGYYFFRDPATGDARYLRHSSTTMAGALANAMGGDTSRRMSNITARMRPFTAEAFTATVPEKLAIGRITADNQRPVPIVRSGLTAKENDQIANNIRRYGTQSDSYLAAKAAPYLGRNPTPLGNTFLNTLREFGDTFSIPDALATIATGGVAAIGKKTMKEAAESAASAALKSGGRQIGEEVVQGGAQSVPLAGASGFPIREFVWEPMESSPLQTDEDGIVAHPDEPRYGGVVDRNWQRETEQMQQNIQQYRRRTAYPRPIQ